MLNSISVFEYTGMIYNFNNYAFGLKKKHNKNIAKSARGLLT